MSRGLSDLKEKTADFFNLHWSQEKLGPPPRWSEPYCFVGPLPNHSKQGIYAFFEKGTLTYIGVGASRGSGIYLGAGLGARVTKYLRVKKGGRGIEAEKRPYEPIAKLKNVDEIFTLAFEKEHGYLSYALEVYLVSRLEPRRNFQKPGQ